MEKHCDKGFLNKIFYIEDILKEYAKNDINELYIEHFVGKVDVDIATILELLTLISERSPWKISVGYRILCPKCKNKVERYLDIKDVVFGEETSCEECGVFTRETKNTYICFIINEDWINWLKQK